MFRRAAHAREHEQEHICIWHRPAGLLLLVCRRGRGGLGLVRGRALAAAPDPDDDAGGITDSQEPDWTCIDRGTHGTHESRLHLKLAVRLARRCRPLAL